MIDFVKMFLVTIFIVACVYNCSSLNLTPATKNIQCPSIHISNVVEGGHKYCNCTYKEFQRNYTKTNLKLTSLLEKLRAWNCFQFKDECENRSFDFNRYTFLVYEKFCNNSNFLKVCSKELNNTFHPDFHNATSRKLRMYRHSICLNCL